MDNLRPCGAEREKYKFLPKHIQHIATIVYIGSTRPRNENSVNVNLNDAPAIEAWQNKRHLRYVLVK